MRQEIAHFGPIHVLVDYGEFVCQDLQENRKEGRRKINACSVDDIEALSGDTARDYLFRRSGTNENAVAETVGVVMNQKKR